VERSDAVRGADVILDGFEDLQERFRAITRHAVERFERRDWQGIRRDTVRRLALHGSAVDETLETLRSELGPDLEQRDLWAQLKLAYAEAILGRDDFELAQTFFNSLTRRLFDHAGIDPSIDFQSHDFPLPYKGWELASARMYATRDVTPTLVRRILRDAGLRLPLHDEECSMARVAEKIRATARDRFGTEAIEALEMLEPLFVRNKAAYLIGRARRGEAVFPVLLALLNDERGLSIDAVVTSEEGASVIFSFARWYFHADVAAPRTVIGFMHSILPRKRIAELYISLGYNKHGKTEFFANLSATIRNSNERFVVAPGQRGLVMSVFTLPSYEFVFKVIKDRFPPPKQTTRSEVMARYRLVHLHDRVGRLVDFQEYEHLEFPRSRFGDELLDELTSEASRTVLVTGDEVVVKHVYVGRKVTPLDLFIQRAEPQAREAAVIDWGRAIKELAAANIFAGDMLAKNFGVTRHGRVVFYDYDEIRPLSSCNFRRFPPPRDDLDEMAAEPWFSVAENDVFPEEMRRFLGLGGGLEEVFVRHHRDLFEAEFWSRLQERNREGEPIDFFPYTRAQRLRPEAPEPEPA
jgi:isocitrate dehydrogenase kinase/phosphatase